MSASRSRARPTTLVRMSWSSVKSPSWSSPRTSPSPRGELLILALLLLVSLYMVMVSQGISIWNCWNPGHVCRINRVISNHSLLLLESLTPALGLIHPSVPFNHVCFTPSASTWLNCTRKWSLKMVSDLLSEAKRNAYSPITDVLSVNRRCEDVCVPDNWQVYC